MRHQEVSCEVLSVSPGGMGGTALEWETPGLRKLAPRRGVREGPSGQKGQLGHPRAGEPGTPEDLGEGQEDCRAEKGEEEVQRVVPPSPQTPGSAGKQWDGDGDQCGGGGGQGDIFNCQP